MAKVKVLKSHWNREKRGVLSKGEQATLKENVPELERLGFVEVTKKETPKEKKTKEEKTPYKKSGITHKSIKKDK